MKAVFSNDAEKTNYVDKEIPFVSTGNGTYDAQKLYKLSVFCTSSKKYDQMIGAPGSCLSVKRLEVIAK